MEPDFDWTRQSAPFPEICQYPGMLFYAGRSDDFERFLGEFPAQCPNMRPQQPIVGGDAVSRLIEDPTRREGTHSTLPLVYVSDAHHVTCEQQPAYDTWRAFRDRIMADPFRVCAPDSRHRLSERMELAYDATHAFLLAVAHLAPRNTWVDPLGPMHWTTTIPLTPGAVWRSLGEISFDGVTGLIDFTSGRVQRNKAIALLAIDEIGAPAAQPRAIYHCGRVVSAAPAPPQDCAPGDWPTPTPATHS